jgi:hypothetical protein
MMSCEKSGRRPCIYTPSRLLPLHAKTPSFFMITSQEPNLKLFPTAYSPKHSYFGNWKQSFDTAMQAGPTDE